MYSAILLSVLQFSDGLDLLKEDGLRVIFILFVLERFTPVLSGAFKLTTSLESTVPKRMSTISVSKISYVHQRKYNKSKSFSFFIRTPKT